MEKSITVDALLSILFKLSLEGKGNNEVKISADCVTYNIKESSVYKVGNVVYIEPNE